MPPKTAGTLPAEMSRIIPPPIAVMTPIRIEGITAKPNPSALEVPVAAQQPSTSASKVTRVRRDYLPSKRHSQAIKAPSSAMIR